MSETIYSTLGVRSCAYIESNFGYDLNKTLEEIQERSNDLARQRQEFRATGIATDGYMNMSNAALSCPMAIMAFLMGEDFEESIRYSMAMLGDSDSIACMAGSISAQLYGIPQQLVDEALVYLPIEMVDVLNKFEGDMIQLCIQTATSGRDVAVFVDGMAGRC